jgi:tetratricopeptide (TPR) repeat protein
LSEAEQNLKIALQMSKKSGYDSWAVLIFIFLGLLHYEREQYQESQDCCEDLLSVYGRMRQTPSFARFAQIMKVAAGTRRRLNPPVNTTDFREIKFSGLRGWAAQAMAQIYLHMDDSHTDEAEAWIRRAIEIDEQNRMPWSLARAHALYAEFFKKKAKQDKAKENLHQAIEIWRRCGADGWVEKYERELAFLRTTFGLVQ